MWDVIVVVLQCGAVALLVLGCILSIKFSRSLPEPHLLDGGADVVLEPRVDVPPKEDKWATAMAAVEAEVSPQSELRKAA